MGSEDQREANEIKVAVGAVAKGCQAQGRDARSHLGRKRRDQSCALRRFGQFDAYAVDGTLRKRFRGRRWPAEPTSRPVPSMMCAPWPAMFSLPMDAHLWLSACITVQVITMVWASGFKTRCYAGCSSNRRAGKNA